VKTEQEAFNEYLEAIGHAVGHSARSTQARRACPTQFAAWREAFIAAYGYDPA